MLAPATVKNYEYFAEAFLKPKLGHHAVQDLTTRDFEELFFEMADAGFVTSTIQKCRVTASGAMKLAQRRGLVEQNVVHLAEGPKSTPPEFWVPNADEVQRFLAWVSRKERDIYDFARVLAATGVRSGEGCGLRPEDLEGVRLHIVRSIDISEGRTRVTQAKSGRARCITIGEPTAQVIRSRRGRYVFGGEEPGRPDLYAKKMKRLALQAGVRITPTSLRHFHAVQLLSSGRLSASQVAERLGHSNPGETLRMYARFIPSRDAVAAEVIEQVLEAQ